MVPTRNNVTFGIAGVSKETNFYLSVSVLPLPHFSVRARNPVCHETAEHQPDGQDEQTISFPACRV
jgi:hypothetical protein